MDKEIYVLWEGSDDADYAGRVKETIVGAFDSERELIEYVQKSVRDLFTAGADRYVRIPASYEFVAGSDINCGHGLDNSVTYYCRFEKCKMM